MDSATTRSRLTAAALLCLCCAPAVLSRPHALEARRSEVIAAFSTFQHDHPESLPGRHLQDNSPHADGHASDTVPGAQQAAPSHPTPPAVHLATAVEIDAALQEEQVDEEADVAPGEGVRHVSNFEELQHALAQGSPLVEITDHIKFSSHQSALIHYVGSQNIAIWGRCLTPPPEEELPETLQNGPPGSIAPGTCLLNIPSNAINPVHTMFAARHYKLKNVWMSNLILAERGREVTRTRPIGLRGVQISRARLWLSQSSITNFGSTAVDLAGNDAIISDVLLAKGYAKESNGQQAATAPAAALRAFASRTIDINNCRFVDMDSETPGPAMSIVSISPVLTYLRLEDLSIENYAQEGADSSEIAVSAAISSSMPQFFVQDALTALLEKTATRSGRKAPYYPLEGWPSPTVLEQSDVEWLQLLVQVKVPASKVALRRARTEALAPSIGAPTQRSSTAGLSRLAIALISSLATSAFVLALMAAFVCVHKRRHPAGRRDPYASLPMDSTATTPGTGAGTTKSHANSPTFLDRLHAGLDKVASRRHVERASHTEPFGRTRPPPAASAVGTMSRQASEPLESEPTLIASEYWHSHTGSLRSSTQSVGGSVPLELMPPTKKLCTLPFL